MIRLIAAIDQRRGIGKHGTQPWHLPEDSAYFNEQTMLHGGNVLVARTTFQNNLNDRPLTQRHTYVLTHHTSTIKNVTVIRDLESFLMQFTGTQDLWVIGGTELYAQTLAAGYGDELYLTHIAADFACDRFFPSYEADFERTTRSSNHTQNNLTFYYAIYKRKA